jgi:hypothetical protein
MPCRFHLARAVAVALALPLTLTAPLAGQLKVSGFAEASYAYSTNADGDAIVGHLFDRFHDQFTLNGFHVAAEKAAATNKWDAGVRFDVVLGQDAEVLHSTGFALGASGDITQLYITLNVPNGPRFKLGKFVTLMGVEVIETVANPVWSEGLQFVYVENFAATGLEVGFKLGDKADLQVRVSNCWDRVVSIGHKDFMARVGLYPDGSTSIGLLGYHGAQQNNSDATRTGFEVVVNKKFGSTSLWIQGDYGTEEANAALADPTQDASWFALGAWLAFDASPKLGVAFRVDYLNDQNGFRTGGVLGFPAGGAEHNLWSATGNLNIKTWPSTLVRPEVRYDKSNLAVFDGEQSQLVLALSVAYIF